MSTIVDHSVPEATDGSHLVEAIPEPSRSGSPSGGQRPKKKKKKYYARTAKRGALWSIVKQGAHEIVGIPMSMIMARLLSPHDFGIAAAASFFVLLSTRLTQFGLNAALVRIKELRPDHLSTVFVLNLVLGGLTYLALVTAAPSIGAFLRSPEAGDLLEFAALIFLVNPFGTVPAALISRNMQFRHGTITDWSDMSVSVTLCVVLAWKGYGPWSIVAGHLAGAVVRVVLKNYFCGWRPSLIYSRRAMAELLSFGLGVQTKRLLEYASFNLDNLIVGRVLGMSALGFYDKAFTTMNRIVNRLTLGNAYFRIFSIIHEDPDRFRRAYSRLVLTISLIGVPAFTVAILVAEPLFELMYGETWLPAVLPFQMLCVGGILKLLNAYASQANEAVGNVWPQARRQALGAVAVVAGAWFGSHYGGLTGAATGVALAMVLLTVAMQTLVRRSTGLTWREMLTPQMPALTVSAGLALLLVTVKVALESLSGPPAAWQLLPAQAVAGVAFYATFVLFSPFPAVRELVAETLHDFMPQKSGRILALLRMRATKS